MNEQELRARIASEPQEGYRQLFDTYTSYVYAIVWGQLSGVGSREDAEEVVSDVFVEVFRRMLDIREGGLKSYIAAVARNKAATAFHRLSGSRTESLDDPSCAELPDPADIPAEQEKADEVHRLMRSIRALGELDSTIVLARYYYGLSSGEIGRMTGLSPSAARMRLRRALLKLKRELTKEEFL